MTVFTGHTGNAGHFLQPTASAMGHRTTPFSQGSRQLAYPLSRTEAKRAHALTHVIARSSRRGARRFVIATTEGGAVRQRVVRKYLIGGGVRLWLGDGDEPVLCFSVREMEGSNLLPEAKRTGVASVGRILREHPEIEAVLVGDGARGTLRSLSAARAGTVWTADRSKNFDFRTVYFTRKPGP